MHVYFSLPKPLSCRGGRQTMAMRRPASNSTGPTTRRSARRTAWEGGAPLDCTIFVMVTSRLATRSKSFGPKDEADDAVTDVVEVTPHELAGLLGIIADHRIQQFQVLRGPR